MNFDRMSLDLIDEDDIAVWGEYADSISSTDSEFAEEIYQKILTVDGEHTTALSNYAIFLQMQDRFREAKLIYSRLLQLESANPNLYFRYGAFCVETGEFEVAEKYFIKFLDQEILAAERLMDKANELSEQKKFRAAEWYYRFMMQQIPEDPFICNNYALLLADLGRFSEAESFFKKALAENEEMCARVGVEFNYANLLFLLGRIDEAEHFYKQALKNDPKDLPVLNNYVSLLIRRAEFAKAEELAQEILSVNPSDIMGLQNYSNLLLREKRYDKAIFYAQSLVETYPNFAQSYFQLASVFAESGKLEDAISVLEKALHIEPDHIDAMMLLAVIFSDMKRFEESETLFEKALLVHPGDAMLRFHYAAMLFDSERYDDAERWIKSLLEGDQTYAEAMSLMGNILKLKGQIYEAHNMIEQSIKKDPENPEILLQAALFFHDIQDYIKSDTMFFKALELSPNDIRILEEKNRCEQERMC